MAERTPEQILQLEQSRKDKPFWLLPQTGVYDEIYGQPSMLYVAVMTRSNSLGEARISLQTRTPDELMEAYTEGLKKALVKQYPQADSISVGRGSLTALGNNGSRELLAGVELINGDVTTRYAKGKTEDEAIRNAIVCGFEELLK